MLMQNDATDEHKRSDPLSTSIGSSYRRRIGATPIGFHADHLCYAVSPQREHASVRLVPEQSVSVHM